MECLTVAYKIGSLQVNHFVHSRPSELIISHMVTKFLTLQNKTNIPFPESVLYGLHLYILCSWFLYI